MHQESEKDDFTTHLQAVIQRAVPNARETERAEATLTALSFQSLLLPNRHVWVETFHDGHRYIEIDFEDWDQVEGLDKAVAYHQARSAEEASSMIVRWLAGDSIEAIID